MGINIELQLLTTMLEQQNFTPLIKGEIVEDHFSHPDAQSLFHFIATYRHTTGGAAKFPTLSIVKNRFEGSGVQIPDPELGAELSALVYETQLQKLRGDIQGVSIELDELSVSGDPVDGLMEYASTIRQLASNIHPTEHISVKNSVMGVVEDYDEGNIRPEGVPYVWPTMQQHLKGMHSGEFYVFAGRPKSRKTFTVLCAMVHAFMEHGQRVLIITPEMPPRQILLRVLSFMAKLRYSEFKDSELNDDELQRFIEVAETFGAKTKWNKDSIVNEETEDDDAYAMRLNSHMDIPEGHLPPSLDIVQGTGKSVAWIEGQIEIYNPDIVFVDSFYRLKPEGGRKNDSEWRAITGVSRSMKDMAMERKVAVVGTYQMNRAAEDKIGSLANLALADAIGQDADLICRVITGQINGEDHSALVVLGGREAPFDGVLIKNKPCFDFSEVCPITNFQIVKDLMIREDEEAKEEAKRKKGKGKGEEEGPSAASKAARAKLAKRNSHRRRVTEEDKTPRTIKVA